MSSQDNMQNNGGKTDYYALPLPTVDQILKRLAPVIDVNSSREDLHKAAQSIIDMLPSTLLDIHKYKSFTYHQHEISKANYAIQARAEKNGGSMKRELNKIIFYAQEWVKEIAETLEK